MEKIIKVYKIAYGGTSDSVSLEVQHFIDLGYQPLGPISVSTTFSNITGEQKFIFAQVVVLYE